LVDPRVTAREVVVEVEDPTLGAMRPLAHAAGDEPRDARTTPTRNIFHGASSSKETNHPGAAGIRGAPYLSRGAGASTKTYKNVPRVSPRARGGSWRGVWPWS